MVGGWDLSRAEEGDACYVSYLPRPRRVRLMLMGQVEIVVSVGKGRKVVEEDMVGLLCMCFHVPGNEY